MGNLDRLLDALARQLPPSADRASIAVALKKAARALPESQTKTKTKLERTEEACIEKVANRLQEAAAHEAVDDAAEEEAESVHSDNIVEDQEHSSVVAAYQGISDDDPGACVTRCSELLHAASVSLRPAERAAEALDGLLAVLPTDNFSMTDALIEQCIQLVPVASAALCHREPLAWQRFLGFVLLAPKRMKGVKVKEASQRKAAEISIRAGGVIAIVASPACARSALRHALCNFEESPIAAILACIAPGILLLLRTAYGRLDVLKAKPVNRSDLLALLHALRFVALCRNAGTGETHMISEASDLLRMSLEGHFPLTTLSAELQRLDLMKSKRRRLANGGSSSDKNLASKVASTLVSSCAKIAPADISRLVECSGLPAGEEEETDRKALAARARGDLFFEDIAGNDEPTAEAGEGDDSLIAEVSAQAAAGSIIRLDGVEDLKQSKVSKKKKRD